MDAVMYLKEARRMCDITPCSECYAHREDGCIFGYNKGRWLSAEEIVAIVEKWSKEHPVQTNADKFKEVFGISLGMSTEIDENIFVWGQQPYKAPKEDNE